MDALRRGHDGGFSCGALRGGTRGRNYGVIAQVVLATCHFATRTMCAGGVLEGILHVSACNTLFRIAARAFRRAFKGVDYDFTNTRCFPCDSNSDAGILLGHTALHGHIRLAAYGVHV